MSKEDISQYLVSIVKPLVLNPEVVKCNVVTDELGILLLIDLEKKDMGRVIGRKGSTIDSIRNIVRTVGLTHGMRVSIKVPDQITQ